MGFELNHVCPGIVHIRDAMGVCMTLIEGEKAALLIDTGYGIEDVSAFAAALTNKPLTILLTHNHHDHALGTRWFEKTVMLPEDMADWSCFTGQEKRKAVFAQAQSKGLPVAEDDFLSGECKTPYAIHGGTLDLGGLTAEIIPCPGHTPGSCVVFVPQRKLLLTGDAWNPCTWVFFEAALPIRAHRENIRRLLKLDFAWVLCAHQLDVYPREKFAAFVEALTDEALCSAKPVKIGGNEHTNTYQLDLPDGQWLVFDWDKFMEE